MGRGSNLYDLSVRPDDLVSILRRERSRMVGERQKLLGQVSEVDEAIQATDILLRRYGHAAEKDASEGIDHTTESKDSESALTGDTSDEEHCGDFVCGNAMIADIEDCGTQREALYIIARKNDGLLELNPASDLILAAGLSRGQRSSVVGTLHHFMTESPDWEWTAPSTFRLIRDAGSTDFDSESE